MSEPILLNTPLDARQTRNLVVGQEVLLSGVLVTARDLAHKYLVEREDSDGLPYDLAGAVIYHCGPIMQRAGNRCAGDRCAGDRWQAVSAGPTTSARMELYQAKVIERYRVGAVLGKGGMGPLTAAALAKSGAVYLAAAAGAGALLAKRIAGVASVWKLDEFGEPEAMWKLEVAGLPAIVAMDSRGGDLYAQVEKDSASRLKALLGGVSGAPK